MKTKKMIQTIKTIPAILLTGVLFFLLSQNILVSEAVNPPTTFGTKLDILTKAPATLNKLAVDK